MVGHDAQDLDAADDEGDDDRDERDVEVVVERELFLDAGGFNETLKQAEDRDLLVRLQRRGIAVGHVSETWIATSPRRLHALPFRLAILTTFWRWTLGQAGIGRRWPY